MAGFGLTPMGLAPFGLGTPLAAPNAATGTWGSRFLDPLTKDWSLDPATGQYRQMPPVRQRVYFALAETFGSSTVRRDDGLLLPDKMGDGFERLQEAAVRQALRQLTDVERVIRLTLVLTNKLSSQRAHTLVQWVDLTTGEEDFLELPNGRPR